MKYIPFLLCLNQYFMFKDLIILHYLHSIIQDQYYKHQWHNLEEIHFIKMFRFQKPNLQAPNIHHSLHLFHYCLSLNKNIVEDQLSLKYQIHCLQDRIKMEFYFLNIQSMKHNYSNVRVNLV